MSVLLITEKLNITVSDVQNLIHALIYLIVEGSKHNVSIENLITYNGHIHSYYVSTIYTHIHLKNNWKFLAVRIWFQIFIGHRRLLWWKTTSVSAIAHGEETGIVRSLIFAPAKRCHVPRLQLEIWNTGRLYDKLNKQTGKV